MVREHLVVVKKEDSAGNEIEPVVREHMIQIGIVKNNDELVDHRRAKRVVIEDIWMRNSFAYERYVLNSFYQ